MNHGPTCKQAAARAIDQRVRLELYFPVGNTKETWSMASTLDVDDAERLADDLRAAAHVARVVKQKSEKPADERSGG